MSAEKTPRKSWLYQRKIWRKNLRKAREVRLRRIRRHHKLFGPPKRKNYHIPVIPTREEALIHWDKVLDNLIALSKGKVDARSGEWFYRLFFGYNIPIPSTLEDIRRKLEEAYWIEEEDIKQQILTIVWWRQLRYCEGYWLKYNIARYLRDWLVKQKVFQPNNWTELYDSWFQEQSLEAEDLPGLSVVLDGIPKWSGRTLFERYILYLNNIMDLQRNEISDILLTTTRQINRYQTLLKELLEDAHHFTE